MREIWLGPNRRAILFGCIPPLFVAIACLWFAVAAKTAGVWSWLSGAISFIAFFCVVILVAQLMRPRIAFRVGHVLFYIRRGTPIALPVHVVEAFFAGQGPAYLPTLGQPPQTVNLIARLSQRHSEWAQQEVKPALGNWSDGYVTVRGTWCEPLNSELIRKLNRRLKEVKDETEASR